MGIVKNGKAVQRIYYVDAGGQEHIILLAYRGDDVVWNGHVSQQLQVPVMKATALMPMPDVRADALVSIDAPMSGYAEMAMPDVAASSAAAPPPMLAAGLMPDVDLTADQILDVPEMDGAAMMPDVDIRVLAGIVLDSPMLGTAAMPDPSVRADATVDAGAMTGTASMPTPDIGSYTIIAPDPMLGTSAMPTPDVRADAQVASPPTMSGTGMMPVPSLAYDASVAAPTMTGTASMPTPVNIIGGSLTRQRANKSGNTNVGTGTGNAKQVTGWTSDATYPATITSDELVIAGAGPVTITLQWNLSGGSQGSGKFVQLYRNTTELLDQVNTGTATSSTALRPLSWSGTVADGDRIRMAIKDLNGAGACTVNASGTYIDVNP